MSDIVFKGFDNFDSSLRNDDENVHSAKADKRMAVIKILVTILAIVFVLELFVFIFIKPMMGNVDILWNGLSTYDQAFVARAIEPVRKSSILNLRAKDVTALLSNVSGIESVKIEKRFPNTVVINVKERVPVAMTFMDVKGRTVPIQIDKNGVLFMNPNAASKTSSSIPLISGIPVENIPEGKRLPSKYCDLMGQIAYIQSLSQPYFSAISEIHVVPKEFGNYELVLYPVHSRTRVLTGRQLTEGDLQYMMVALDAVNTLEPNVEEIDLRYGSIAYRTRESSGESFER